MKNMRNKKKIYTNIGIFFIIFPIVPSYLIFPIWKTKLNGSFEQIIALCVVSFTLMSWGIAGLFFIKAGTPKTFHYIIYIFWIITFFIIIPIWIGVIR